MIEKITVKNYQSLYNVEVELGKFTVLYGNSDVGKSAFYRAIRGLLVGEVGDDFISVETNRTGVSIKKASGAEIVWLKPRGKSSTYMLFQDGEKVKEWRRARQIPRELEVLLQVRPIVVDGDKFYPNLRGQFDPLFLLFESSSKRARVLGSLVSNLLLQGIKSANVERNRNEADIRAVSSLAEDLERKMEVNWANMHMSATALSSYASNLKERNFRCSELRRKQKRYEAFDDVVNFYQRSSLKGISDALVYVDRHVEFVQKYEKLFPVYKKYRALKRLQTVELALSPQEEVEKALRVENVFVWLKPLYARVKTLNRDIFLAGKEYEKVLDEVGEFEVEIRKAKAVATVVCPHCGKEFIHGTD